MGALNPILLLQDVDSCQCFFLYYIAFTEVFKSMVEMIFHMFCRGQLMQAATQVKVLLPK